MSSSPRYEPDCTSISVNGMRPRFFQPMDAAERQIEALVLLHQHLLRIPRHHGGAVHHHPMLRAMEVLLQGQLVPWRHHDALHLEALALNQALVETPRPVDPVMRHRLRPARLAQPVDDPLDLLRTGRDA